MMHRRNFLRGLFAAPAIVAYDRIMPVKLFEPFDLGTDALLVHTSERYSFGYVDIRAMRDLLLPGLKHVVGTYKRWPEFPFDEGRIEL